MTLDEHIKLLLKEDFQQVIQPAIDAAVKPLKEEIERLRGVAEVVDEYMPIKFFLSKYDISAKTFRQVLKVNYVGSKRVFKHKHFHVQQWQTAQSMYSGKKPNI